MTYLPETYLKELNQQITSLLKKEKNMLAGETEKQEYRNLSIVTGLNFMPL